MQLTYRHKNRANRGKRYVHKQHTHSKVCFCEAMDFHLADWLDECSDRNLLLRPRGNHKDFPNCLSTEQKQPIAAPWQQWQLNAEIQKAEANYLWTAASWLRLWTTPLSAGTYSWHSFSCYLCSQRGDHATDCSCLQIKKRTVYFISH